VEVRDIIIDSDGKVGTAIGVNDGGTLDNLLAENVYDGNDPPNPIADPIGEDISSTPAPDPDPDPAPAPPSDNDCDCVDCDCTDCDCDDCDCVTDAAHDNDCDCDCGDCPDCDCTCECKDDTAASMTIPIIGAMIAGPAIAGTITKISSRMTRRRHRSTKG
jgi:hypothetical protein